MQDSSHLEIVARAKRQSNRHLQPGRVLGQHAVVTLRFCERWHDLACGEPWFLEINTFQETFGTPNQSMGARSRMILATSSGLS